MAKLPEAPLGEAERRFQKPSLDGRDLEIHPEPELEIQVIPEDPEEIAVREGVHQRIQAEIHHEDMEAKAAAEEILEVLQNGIKFLT